LSSAPPTIGRRILPWVAAAALAAAAVVIVRDHTRGDALSADEPVHILAGYFQVKAKTAIVNIEHPPLAKALAGLALLPLPLSPLPEAVPMGDRFTAFGHEFLFANRSSPDEIAAAARAPFLAVLAALVLLVFAAARRRWGTLPALFAAALLAFDPNMLAHAGVVHTDLSAALAFLGTILCWDWAQRRPSIGRLAAAGAVLGLALATKFSAIYLIPILLLQGLLAARTSERPGKEALATIGRLAAVGAAAIAVVLIVYAPVTAKMNRAHQQQVIHEMVALRGAPNLSAGIQAVARASPPLGHYLGGLASVVRQNAEGGGINTLFGRVSDRGFPEYFFVAFAAKSTPAFLIVTALALAGFVRGREGRQDGALWLLPVLVLFLASAGSSYNIGIRHMLPVYPLLAMAGAGALSRLAAVRPRAGVLLMAALPIASAAALARIHPHELSYFNAFVGGPEGGRRMLSDSNVDWGLDLRRLSEELARRGVSDPTVAYFGGDDVAYRVGVPDFSAEPFVRGRVIAVSAFLQAVGPAYYAYHGAPQTAAALSRLLAELESRGRRLGRVGWSIDLWELMPPGEESGGTTGP
jgi:4-amino-4-deoxy-L-arabinose transferase-like glycosyltransferase